MYSKKEHAGKKNLIPDRKRRKYSGMFFDFIIWKIVFSEKLDMVFVCRPQCVFGPDGRLHFTDVRFSEVEHADAGLANSSAYCAGKLPVEKRFLKIQPGTVFTAGDFQLTPQRSFVDTDSHGGELKCYIKNRIVDENVSVQFPVIIVGSAPVVRLSGDKCFPDL